MAHAGGRANQQQVAEEDDIIGNYNAQKAGEDRIIDANTIVRNLRTDKLELKEKIFADKPARKQLGISLEDDKNVA